MSRGQLHEYTGSTSGVKMSLLLELDQDHGTRRCAFVVLWDHSQYVWKPGQIVHLHADNGCLSPICLAGVAS